MTTENPPTIKALTLRIGEGVEITTREGEVYELQLVWIGRTAQKARLVALAPLDVRVRAVKRTRSSA
jgi:hypothetical protein